MMRNERAQTLVMVALMLVVLLDFLALVLDGGNLYLERRQMQTAADAGALAAAKAWCMSQADWQSVGDAYCGRNASTGYTITCNTGAGTAAPVRVTASEPVQTWFARILGSQFATVTVSAEAEATCNPVGSTGTLWPVAVMAGMPNCDATEIDGCFLTGSENIYELWDKEDNEYKKECEADPLKPQCDDTSGAFGFLRWNDSPCGLGGANLLKQSILSPNCATGVTVPSTIYSEPGAELGSVKDEMATWCDQDVPVPLYRTRTEGGGQNTGYNIEAIGVFHLTGICTGRNKPQCPEQPASTCDSKASMVMGYFTGETIQGFGSPDAPDTGAYVVYLVR